VGSINLPYKGAEGSFLKNVSSDIIEAPRDRGMTRRCLLSSVASSVSVLTVPQISRGGEIGIEERGLIRNLIGTYDLRPEWLFSGMVLVEKFGGVDSKADIWRGSADFKDRRGREWIQHYKAPDARLTAEVTEQQGRLQVNSNFIWIPKGMEPLGPGPIFQARLDGEEERFKEPPPPGQPISNVDRYENIEFLENGVRRIEERWFRYPGRGELRALGTRLSTLAVHADGHITLDVVSLRPSEDHPGAVDRFKGDLTFTPKR
jgi:hypothetical protein